MENTKKKDSSKISLVSLERSEFDDTLLSKSDLTSLYPVQGLVHRRSNLVGGLHLPPYNPAQLQHLRQHNNILSQCIETMVVNIDRTGIRIVDESGEVVEQSVEKEAKDSLDALSLNKTFMEVRSKIRTDLETVGYAYLSLLETPDGDLAGWEVLDPKCTRIISSDKKGERTRVVNAFGKERTIVDKEDLIGYVSVAFDNQKRYYKDYKVETDIDHETGDWAVDGVVVPKEAAGGRVIMFTCLEDVTTLYSVPRWINQIPSVLGSRKAEELNLEFFDSGGIPPAIAFINGGMLTESDRTTLTNYLANKAKHKQRMVVLELQSTSGDVHGSGSPVSVKVERFGSEQQDDSLFEKYDDKCSLRIRSAFRLSPLFIGRTEDYTLATAKVSLESAEAQVFSPERVAFDDKWNDVVMPLLSDTLRIKSIPLTSVNSEDKIKLLEVSKDVSSRETFIDEVNSIGSTNLELGDDASPKSSGPSSKQTQQVEKRDISEVSKMRSAISGWCSYMKGESSLTEGQVADIAKEIQKLDYSSRQWFFDNVDKNLGTKTNDIDGVLDLVSCGCYSSHGG